MTAACLVLDFDGTILDTEAPVYRSWAELYDAHGHVLDRGEWQELLGTAAGFDPWAELERRVGSPLDAALATHRRARRDALQALEDVRPGVLRWLAEARQLAIPVGIASSSPTDWVESHLARLELRHHFEVVLCAEGAVPPKPDPTSYQLACTALGADPARSVAVEDSPHGVAAAVRAGLFTVAVPHGLTFDLDLSLADRQVGSLEELTLGVALAAAAGRHHRA